MTEMELEKEREKIRNFVKVGLFTLSIVLLFGCIFIYIPKAVSTYFESDKTVPMPIHSVECKDKKVAISFEVAGSEAKVDRILKVLQRQGIKATFFVTGEWVTEHPLTIQRICKEGHDIENHSQSHKEMSGLTKDECKEEIEKVHEKVKALTGQTMKLFRSPYKEFNATISSAVEELGYYPIGGNVDSMDWKDYGVDAVINEICNNQNLEKGSIILCHTNTKFTSKALDKVITVLKKRGYTFDTISNMIYTSNFYIDKKGKQMKNVNP